MLKILNKKIRILFLSCSGAAAIIFGITLPAVVSAVGLSVDMSQSLVVKERLGRAVDAAALAAAAMDSDDLGEIEDKVDKFLLANYPPNVIGSRISMNVTLDAENDLVTVVATARLKPAFAKIMGVSEVDISARSTVKREVRGLEVALVLDNTGSMSNNNNIDALKTASSNFVDIMFDAVSDPEHIRIGVVPYSSSVNVGPYGMGEDESGFPLPSGGFVEPPSTDVYKHLTHSALYNDEHYGIDETDLVYDPSEYGQWHGCVEAEPYPLDVQDHSGPWVMYRYDFEGSTDNWYRQHWNYGYTNGERYNSYYGPNYHCPDQPIVPLTSDQGTLEAAIENMGAEGFTLGNYGTVWGWRVLSSDLPFDEGADYDDPDWEKAIVIMTDGLNTMNHAYTAYGKTNTHSIRTAQENDRFIEVCNAMKNRNILVYTITFEPGTGASTPESLFESCASDTTKYFHAPSQSKLVDVFEQIARELSNLHITQ